MIQASNSYTATGGNAFMDMALKKLDSAAKSNLTDDQARKVAKDFEALFVSQMLEHMFSGESLGTDLFGSAESDEIYQGMMVDQYARKISDNGGIGIATYIQKSLIERANAGRALLAAQEVQS